MSDKYFSEDVKTEDILALFGVVADDVEGIQGNVWLIDGKNEKFILKQSFLEEKKLKFVCLCEEQLKKADFPCFAELISTKTGENYCQYQGGFFTLHRYIEGEKCDFNNIDHLAMCSRTLGQFHLKATDIGSVNKDMIRHLYFDHMRYFKDRIKELDDFAERCKCRPKNSFEWLYLSLYPLGREKAVEALEVIEKSNYKQLAVESRDAGTFIHYDVASRNYIIGEDAAYLIDFDYAAADLQLVDLSRLIKRALRVKDNNEKRLRCILSNYHTYKPISIEESKVVYGLMAFPQRFWRLSKRYFDAHDYKNPVAVKKMIAIIDEFDNEDKWLPLYKEIAGDIVNGKTVCNRNR